MLIGIPTIIVGAAKRKATEKLFNAIHDDKLKKVKTAVEGDANINHVSMLGYTPLSTAADKPNANAEIVLYLVQHGAKVNPLIELPPLHVATDPKTIKILLDHGADVSLRDRQGYSALTFPLACKVNLRYCNNLRSLEALIDAGESVFQPVQFFPHKAPIKTESFFSAIQGAPYNPKMIISKAYKQAVSEYADKERSLRVIALQMVQESIHGRITNKTNSLVIDLVLKNEEAKKLPHMRLMHTITHSPQGLALIKNKQGALNAMKNNKVNVINILE